MSGQDCLYAHTEPISYIHYYSGYYGFCNTSKLCVDIIDTCRTGQEIDTGQDSYRYIFRTE